MYSLALGVWMVGKKKMGDCFFLGYWETWEIILSLFSPLLIWSSCYPSRYPSRPY